MRLVALLASALMMMMVSGCDTGTGDNGTDCAFATTNKIVNENGSMHGEPCEKSEDCKYGLCLQVSATAFGNKVCTKQCNCGQLSTCSEDDGNGMNYKCVKTSPSYFPSDKYYSYCMPICKNVDFCVTNVADFYNKCDSNMTHEDGDGTMFVAGQKVCMFE